ncbi:MAG: 1-deoxy-D-xylulose-5-phosphate reductoisomerase [Phycisphaerales bacterium]|nr:1-deoxy-D-xylulose-5-phosphate reductoisomerase [Phycisphaerales bacterium]
MTQQRRLFVLGSTGSIGENTLEVVRHLAAEGSINYSVIGLAAGSNVEKLALQANKLGCAAVAIAHSNAARQWRGPTACQLFSGADSALELVKAHARPGDLVMGAMVGAAGIAPILAAIEAGCDIALANKETLVAAGEIVTEAARRRGVSIIPVDSEHSAVFQCLRAATTPKEVQRIVLTASGGPFRNTPKDIMNCAVLSDALKHPTWSMGRKVTIDSASMMNKALEIIEAHWLFDLPAEKIDAVIHPQSIVHSFVEFVDGSVVAQLSPPDMRLPIQLALTWPARAPRCAKALDWTALRTLEFEPIDVDRFPAVQLAWRVIRAGGTSGAILNAANEAAVDAFSLGSIHFGEISTLVLAALDAIPATAVGDLSTILHADAQARAWVQSEVCRLRVADAHSGAQ